MIKKEESEKHLRDTEKVGFEKEFLFKPAREDRGVLRGGY